jgi:hypothetical protein
MTRWDLPFLDDTEPKSDEWHLNRFEMLERVYMAGVESQTSPPDAWMLMVSSSIPEFARARLLELGLTVIEWPRDRPLLDPELANGLITTRLDSDDRLAPDACERIQKWARESELESVFNFGLGYRVTLDGLVYLDDSADLAYQSLYSSTKQVYQLGDHSTIRQRFDCHIDISSPGFAYFLHEASDSVVRRGERVRRVDSRQFVPNPPDWVLRGTGRGLPPHSVKQRLVRIEARLKAGMPLWMFRTLGGISRRIKERTLR